MTEMLQKKVMSGKQATLMTRFNIFEGIVLGVVSEVVLLKNQKGLISLPLDSIEKVY